MTNNKVTLRDVYDLVERKTNSLETKFEHKIEKLEIQIDCNTDFRNQLVGKMTVIFVVIGTAINFVWDYASDFLKKL